MKEGMKLYQKKGKLILGTSGVVILCLAVLVFLVAGPDPTSIFRPFRDPAIFYPLMVLGLAAMLYILRFAVNSLRHPRPRVILSNDGVVVDGFSGRFSAGWEDFGGYACKDQGIYVLHLKNAQAFVDGLAAGRSRETARALSARFGSPFLIETGLLEVDPNAVAAFLAGRLGQPKT